MSEVISWPSGLLSEKLLRTFLDEFGPFATHISFFHSGEPLLHGLTPLFIRMAREYLLMTIISTNLCVPKFDFEDLVMSGLDYLIVCIDGASEQTYSVYRKHGDFGLVMSNLKRLIATKKRLRSYTPHVVWQFLAFAHNAHEIDQVKVMAADIGVNELNIAEPYPVERYDPSIRLADDVHYERIVFHYDFDKARHNMNAMLEKLNGSAIEACYFQVWQERKSDDWSPVDPSAPGCEWIYKNIAMDATGRILPCCRPPFLTEDLQFADFTQDTDVYNSKKYQLVRRYYAEKETFSDCIDILKDTIIPFCIVCNDPKIPITNTHNVKDYLRTVSLFSPLSEKTISLLTAW
jgi:MoaA/NifB/PqqE/SkfB family radical SAM enzyme